MEMVEKLSKQFPDQPQIARMKGVLATKFAEAAAPTITSTITNWRAITRDEITRALDANTNALALKGDDKRAQAEGAYLRGVLALRDFLTYSAQGATENAPSGGGLTGARSEFEKAIQADDAWAPPHYQLGVVQMYAGDSASAEATFIKVTQMEPKWAFAHCYLGQAYQANGKFKEAIDTFRRALEIDPSYAAAHAGLGLARASKGERDATKDIERAMQLDPSSGLPHLNMAIVLSQSRRRQDRDRAVQEFKTAIQKNAQNLDFLNSRAEQLLANLQKQKR
jgi:Tfp pilus assembly protein PilF